MWLGKGMDWKTPIIMPKAEVLETTPAYPIWAAIIRITGQAATVVIAIRRLYGRTESRSSGALKYGKNRIKLIKMVTSRVGSIAQPTKP